MSLSTTHHVVSETFASLMALKLLRILAVFDSKDGVLLDYQCMTNQKYVLSITMLVSVVKLRDILVA